MAGMTDKQWADVVNFPNSLDAEESTVAPTRIVPAQRPEDIRVGARVAEIYTDSQGTATAVIGIQVVVKWDQPQPEDALVPNPTYDELVVLG